MARPAKPGDAEWQPATLHLLALGFFLCRLYAVPIPRMALTGSDLLAKVKELGDASKSDLVRAAGYVSTKKDGSERLNFTAFYEALLEAKGVSLGDSGGKGKGKAGRSLSYVAKVQFNGNLLVGKAYTALLDLKPGDEFEIKLGKKQIRLVPAGGSDEEE